MSLYLKMKMDSENVRNVMITVKLVVDPVQIIVQNAKITKFSIMLGIYLH